MSIVEFARNVIGYNDAHSVELNPDTRHPVIHLMPDQEGINDIGGTLRLGSYPCVLDENSLLTVFTAQKKLQNVTVTVMKSTMITEMFLQKTVWYCPAFLLTEELLK